MSAKPKSQNDWQDLFWITKKITGLLQKTKIAYSTFIKENKKLKLEIWNEFLYLLVIHSIIFMSFSFIHHPFIILIYWKLSIHFHCQFFFLCHSFIWLISHTITSPHSRWHWGEVLHSELGGQRLFLSGGRTQASGHSVQDTRLLWHQHHSPSHSAHAAAPSHGPGGQWTHGVQIPPRRQR